MSVHKHTIAIADYLSLVRSIASEYSHFGVPYEDLIQEGTLGLIEARRRFDSARKVKFSTYATYWIKKMILETLSSEQKEMQGLIHTDELAQVPSQPAASRQLPLEISPELLHRLPADEAAVLQLTFSLGLPLNTVAEKLNITREHARQLKSKSLRRLRTIQHKAKQQKLPENRKE